MVELAQLTRPKIRRQVGDASLDKAKSYLRDDVWSDLRTQGATIKGRCRGQMPQPYRVAVTFDGDVIATAECSCPAGDGGHCKHVAALLLYYREHPDAFIEVEELEPALERRGKGELVALILRMIRRVPELETLLEAPLPGYSDNAATDDPEPFHGRLDLWLRLKDYPRALADAERLAKLEPADDDVALTRARRKLLVIGDSATLANHPFYQRMLTYFESIGAYSSVWEEVT